MLALSVAEYFELGQPEAQRIITEVGEVVSKWRTEASALGLTARELDRMASAFEHEDLTAAGRIRRASNP